MNDYFHELGLFLIGSEFEIYTITKNEAIDNNHSILVLTYGRIDDALYIFDPSSVTEDLSMNILDISSSGNNATEDVNVIDLMDFTRKIFYRISKKIHKNMYPVTPVASYGRIYSMKN